jgi:tyrosyl-tRNA synthetase
VELTAASGEGLRGAKQTLAREVTALTHGEDAVAAAEAAARALFGGTPDIDDPNIPTTEITTAEAAGITVADAFIAAGLVSSRGEARRKAAEGALWLDGERITDIDVRFRPGGQDSLLRFGKKRYRRVRVVT